MLQRKKLEQARAYLDHSDIDLWVVLSRGNTMVKDPVLPLVCDIYFSGLAAIIVEKGGQIRAITSFLEEDSAKQTGVFDVVEPYQKDGSFEESFSSYLGENSTKTIALDFSEGDPAADGLPYGLYLKFRKLLDQLHFQGRLVSAEPLLDQLRSVKCEEEVECIRRAGELTERIFDEAKAFIRVGVTERQIFDFFQQKCREYGTRPSWELDQCPGVSVYPDTPSGHCGPTDIPVKPGSVVGIDFGVVVDGYCSDMQRMYYILKENETDAPEHLKEAFRAVRDTIAYTKDYLRPGVTGGETDAAARKFLADKGYGDWPHSLGHQVGRFVHDGGALLGRSRPGREKLVNMPLASGNVFAVEPAAYLPEGCFCVEEMVEITPDGARFLTKPQQELYVLKGGEG